MDTHNSVKEVRLANSDGIGPVKELPTNHLQNNIHGTIFCVDSEFNA
uniref:Uncharacterized protein n=1 Tax=Rhizophora mucronata TaxID=61149 RepID=A0A2P2ME98_RHIMU